MTGGGTASNLQTDEARGLGEGWSDAMAECVSRPIWQCPRLTFNLTPPVGCFKPELHLKIITTLFMRLGILVETGCILTRQIQARSACDINKSLPPLLCYKRTGNPLRYGSVKEMTEVHRTLHASFR